MVGIVGGLVAAAPATVPGAVAGTLVNGWVAVSSALVGESVGATTVKFEIAFRLKLSSIVLRSHFYDVSASACPTHVLNIPVMSHSRTFDYLQLRRITQRRCPPKFIGKLAFSHMRSRR